MTPTGAIDGVETVVHLEPDDVIVIRLAAGTEPTPDVLARARAAFAPRSVVILTADVALGRAVEWSLP